ncbi:hypothetical protein [Microseira wollei]|nr:hypothetical protein [Microseira wollei]
MDELESRGYWKRRKKVSAEREQELRKSIETWQALRNKININS